MKLTLGLDPPVAQLNATYQQQLCYLLVSVTGQADSTQAVNWAFVADASRSMRIPIISDSQFRNLVRAGGAQETLIDGVPVWQLSGAVPDEIREQSLSALDYTARALHSIVERLGANDRFALIACAARASVLVESTPGDGRAALVHGIGRLKTLRLGDETDLSSGMLLALDQLERGRSQQRTSATHLLLLTDGFTQKPEDCRSLARQAVSRGIIISTLGVGGEFQDDLLTELADLTGGRALFLYNADAIPAAIAHELATARRVAAPAATLHVSPATGVTMRRATRIRPELMPLVESANDETQQLQLGPVTVGASTTLLLELLVAAGTRPQALAELVLESGGKRMDQCNVLANYGSDTSLPAAVLNAVGRANVARLQRRAFAAAAQGERGQAGALLRAVAQRLQEIGEHTLAATALREAIQLEQTGQTTRLGAKELAYATRRLGLATSLE